MECDAPGCSGFCITLAGQQLRAPPPELRAPGPAAAPQPSYFQSFIIRSFSFQKENSGSSVTPRAFEGQSRNEKAPRGLSRPGCRSCVRPCSRWCRVHPLSACRAAIGALGRRTSAQAETNITTVETRRLHLCCSRVMMLCRPCFWGALKLRLVLPTPLTSRG